MTTATGSGSPRIALVVLGPHRSGTSATARVLSLLGAALPENLMPANDANPRGFWEPLRLVECHDRLLDSLGSRWDDWRALEAGALDDPPMRAFRDEVASLLHEEYGDASLFVLKDPRLCRLVPLYETIFSQLDIEPRYVLLHRDALDATASLVRRESVTAGFAGLLWLRHQLEAEVATRDAVRALLSFEQLREEWRRSARRLAEALRIEWPRPPGEAAAEIEDFLSPEPRGNAENVARLEPHPVVAVWIERTERALETLTASGERGEGVSEAREVLDGVRAELETATRSLGTIVYEEIERRESRLNRTREQASEQLSRRDTALEKLEDRLTARTQELEDRLAARTEELEQARTEATEREKELVGRIAELDTRLGSASDRAKQLDQRVARLETDLRKLLASNSWRLTAPLRALRRAASTLLGRGREESP